MLRPITPLPMANLALRVLTYASSTAAPCGISLDRKTLYGYLAATKSTLVQSVNDGTTWTTVKTGFTGEITAAVETDDGEIIVVTQDTTASPGYIFKSSGWATSHTTATFSLKLTSTGGYFDGRWAGHAFSFGDNRVTANSGRFGIMAEYGPQTSVTYASGNSDTTDLTKARRAFITQDYGATWTKVFDVAAFYPNAVGLHIHSAAYDPYWDRYWITFGDTVTNTVGASALLLLYSDDKGVTWTSVAVTDSGTDGAQSTSIAILPDAIILGSDNRPGVLRIPRVAYRVLGAPQYPIILFANTGVSMISGGLHRNRRQSGAPVLLAVQAAASNIYPCLLVSNDGSTWSELWRDERTTPGQVRAVYGPTLNGVIIASGPNGVLRAGIEDPGTNLAVQRGRFTGDGTTTVFNIPHGLGIKPTRIAAYDMYATAGAYTVTADTTNLIITCTTAPANAAVLLFDARYAA